jgi:hypothetical protein
MERSNMMPLDSLVYSANTDAIKAVGNGLGSDVMLSRYDVSERAIGALAARQFDLVFVDYSADDAATVLMAQKVLSRNSKTLSLVLVPRDKPLSIAFDMGASLAIYDAPSAEGLKKACKTIRALMSRSRGGSPRVPTHICASVMNRMDTTSAVIYDVSESGAAVQTSSQVQVGDGFRLTFTLPTSDVPIEALCQAVRPAKNGSFGVRFTELAQEDRMHLKQWLGRQLPKYAFATR